MLINRLSSTSLSDTRGGCPMRQGYDARFENQIINNRLPLLNKQPSQSISILLNPLPSSSTSQYHPNCHFPPPNYTQHLLHNGSQSGYHLCKCFTPSPRILRDCPHHNSTIISHFAILIRYHSTPCTATLPSSLKPRRLA